LATYRSNKGQGGQSLTPSIRREDTSSNVVNIGDFEKKGQIAI
jgi:hypothetical protein